MIKNLVKHSFIYGIAGVLKNATGFFLLPLYTAYLSVSEYGQLEIIVVSISVMIRLLQMGYGSAIFKYFSYTDETLSKQNKETVSSSTYFILSTAVLILTILYLIRNNIGVTLFEGKEYSPIVTLALVITFFQLGQSIPIAVLRIQDKSITYSILNFGQFLIQITLAIIFVAVLKLKIIGVLTARAIAVVIFAGLFLYSIRQFLVPRFSLEKIRDMFGYAIYLVPVALGNMVIFLSNRYFILSFSDSTQLGVFSLGNKIATILLFAISAFQMAWPSIMFQIKEMPNRLELYSRVITYYVLVFGTILLCLILFSEELILLFSNDNYLPAKWVLRIIASGLFIYGLFYAGTVGINIYKKTYFQSISVGMAAVLNLVLNYFLTMQFGIIGTAIALAISLSVLGILAVYFSQQIFFVPFEWRRIVKLLTVFCIIGLVSNGVEYLTGSTELIIKSLLVIILLPLVLIMLNFFSPHELRKLKLVLNPDKR